MASNPQSGELSSIATAITELQERRTRLMAELDVVNLALRDVRLASHFNTRVRRRAEGKCYWCEQPAARKADGTLASGCDRHTLYWREYYRQKRGVTAEKQRPVRIHVSSEATHV